jgi:LysM repeat protein
MRLSLEQVGRTLHSHGVEITLFQERVHNLETTLNAFKQELKASPAEKALEKRISSLEKANETLIADLKTLKTHLNETGDSLAHCETQLNKIDKQLSSDIQSLKTSLNTMLSLLQNTGGQRSYTVQSGDSLGQIAHNHKTDIKTLKKLNNLTSDVIFTGQKLFIP